jgi:hypothetical protein
MKHEIKLVCSAIEDLAFPFRPSRESDKVGRCCCIEHDFAKGNKLWADTGKEPEGE